MSVFKTLEITYTNHHYRMTIPNYSSFYHSTTVNYNHFFIFSHKSFQHFLLFFCKNLTFLQKCDKLFLCVTFLLPFIHNEVLFMRITINIRTQTTHNITV